MCRGVGTKATTGFFQHEREANFNYNALTLIHVQYHYKYKVTQAYKQCSEYDISTAQIEFKNGALFNCCFPTNLGNELAQKESIGN